MKKRATTLLILLCIISLPGFAQLKPVYVFQQDDTIWRKTCYEQSMEKKNDLIGSLKKEYAAEYKKIYTEHFEQIGQLWQSSRPVTAPGPSEYLQAVLQKIIAANKNLEQLDARIVFSRDAWPNAYSMGDGTIAINAGLMLYLDNEAELVFILCHELAHYYLDHSGKAIRKYVETVNSPAFQQELKRLAKEEYRRNQQLDQLAKTVVFNSRKHSRDNEAEADRYAFMFMKNTGYDCQSIRTALALLDKVDDSLVHKPIDLQRLFDFNEYPFKKKWIEKESSIFSNLDESDSPLTSVEKDSLKTHPDCQKRVAMLDDSLKSMSMANGRKFLVNEKLFKSLKKEFFVEITEQAYREKNLSLNLYYSLVLLQENDKLPYAVYSIARCLNEIYHNQENHTLGAKLSVESKANPGDYNLLLRMLGRLRLEDLASLNHHFCNRHALSMKEYAGITEEMGKAARLINRK